MSRRGNYQPRKHRTPWKKLIGIHTPSTVLNVTGKLGLTTQSCIITPCPSTVAFLSLYTQKRHGHSFFFSPCLAFCLKAALINIFMLTKWLRLLWKLLLMGRITTLQFPSVLWSILASLNSLFWFYGLQLYCFGSVSLLTSTLFPVKKFW